VTVLEVSFGAIAGKKYSYTQTSPVPWKRITYLLSVPGGFVDAILDGGGPDFDETPFESRLHTLRLSAPA
jgi:hypothetical protein